MGTGPVEEPVLAKLHTRQAGPAPSRPHSSAATLAMGSKPGAPRPGATITSSPSARLSPVASSIAKPWETRTAFVPRRGRAASSRRSPAAWRSPASPLPKNSAESSARDERARPKASSAVSRVRQKGLASTRPTGIPSRRKAWPMMRDWRRPSTFRLRCREQSRKSPVMSVVDKSVAA